MIKYSVLFNNGFIADIMAEDKAELLDKASKVAEDMLTSVSCAIEESGDNWIGVKL